ncbi:hypothetical protein BS47DRAFT_1397284 [Hydnum rufescens UP504]|uniref:Uncharacterized protein n=1 Tax=Hydnum rufescens UP504 TaxID=1448309 RepID=A0A9P6DS19_9AGAM|nr:hypothetical protein BS47DRAFT_1397284 [Hydnum rufescens UP504]
MRLDRRADEDHPMDAVKRDGSESVDTIGDVDSLSDLDKTSDTLAEVHCQGSDVDLSKIIKICFGIHRDDKARRYTLQRFNCYFFSWTILVATARHAVPWETLPFDSPWEALSDTLADTLSTKSADALINMVVDAAVIAVMTILPNLKGLLSRAVSRRARLAWAMPNRLIRLALRVMLRTSGRQKIHNILQSRMQSALLSALRPTLRSVLADLRASTLRTTIRKDHAPQARRKPAKQDGKKSTPHQTTTAYQNNQATTEEGEGRHARIGGPMKRTPRKRPKEKGRNPMTPLHKAIKQPTPTKPHKPGQKPITKEAKWNEPRKSKPDTAQKETTKQKKKRDSASRATSAPGRGEWPPPDKHTQPKSPQTTRRTKNAMTT